MASHSKPPSPTKPKQPWLGRVTQNEVSESPGMTSSGDASRRGGPTARAATSAPENIGPQITSQQPTHALGEPQAVVRSPSTPFTGVSGISAPPVMAGISGSASNTKSSGMPYEANAVPPATRRGHSIYPVNSQGRKYVHPEPLTDQPLRPRTLEDWKQASSRDLQGARERVRLQIALQNEVYREGTRLQAEKESKMHLSSGPTPAASENTNRPERNAGHQSDVASDSSASYEKTGETLAESTNGDNEMDLDRNFTMFEDTPRDQCLVEERQEVVFPPFNVVEPDHYPSVSALSSMRNWEPKLDDAYQIDAQLNSSDLRFQVPRTPADIESLQQALDISRMDFWTRNPFGYYPDDFTKKIKTESYASQQRRLQHQFCKAWQTDPDTRDTAPPELYRLPNWMFGFDECYWKPSRWAIDLRSNAYVQGLADMAAAKRENKKGHWGMDRESWKTRLEEQVAAAMAHRSTKLALYAGLKMR